MPDLLNAGFKEPFPLIAKSQDKLVDLLTTWMAICPGKDPPGSVKLDRNYCGHKITPGKQLAFTATSDYVWVERIPISKSHMGWMLKEEDGYCMLVLNNPANNGRWRGYHGWLGGDLGFTSITVADTGPGLRQTLDGQMNDGPKKGNSNSSRRASHESSSFSDLSDFDETEEDGEPMNEPCTNSHNGKSSKRPQPDVGTAETAPVMIKQEPKRTAVRQAAMRRNQIERQTDEQRWRFDTPPLSSMETVKNMRWPPQYVSPPRTPQRKNLRQTVTPKRQNTSAAPDSQAFPHERSSSPEVVAAGPARTPPGTRRSSRVIKRTSYTFKTPLATLSKKSHAPKTPSKDSHKKKASEPLTPISPASTSTAIEPSLSQSADTINVIVHFFLSDDSLGAVPIPLDQCNSVDRFFNQALRAWRFLGIPDGGDSMAGVRVMMEGVQWPIIVAWGEVDAFGWLIDAITKAKGGRTDDLHVQVKCIAK